MTAKGPMETEVKKAEPTHLHRAVVRRIEGSGHDLFSSRILLPGREKLWLLASARCRI